MVSIVVVVVSIDDDPSDREIVRLLSGSDEGERILFVDNNIGNKLTQIDISRSQSILFSTIPEKLLRQMTPTEIESSTSFR